MPFNSFELYIIIHEFGPVLKLEALKHQERLKSLAVVKRELLWINFFNHFFRGLCIKNAQLLTKSIYQVMMTSFCYAGFVYSYFNQSIYIEGYSNSYWWLLWMIFFSREGCSWSFFGPWSNLFFKYCRFYEEASFETPDISVVAEPTLESSLVGIGSWTQNQGIFFCNSMLKRSRRIS